MKPKKKLRHCVGPRGSQHRSQAPHFECINPSCCKTMRLACACAAMAQAVQLETTTLECEPCCISKKVKKVHNVFEADCTYH